MNLYRLTEQGPAISLDNGKTWSWQNFDCTASSQDFYFTATEPGQTALFCMAVPYLQDNLDRFIEKHAGKLSVFPFARTRHGRDTEMLQIREGAPQFKVMLTARHHCCEMMANYVMEGILDAALEDSDFGRLFRKNIAIYAVPFIDKDGAMEGDQGKNRAPWDHNRDYRPNNDGIYPETKAVREWMDAERPDFYIDMHCPWLRGGDHQTAYLLGNGNKNQDRELDRFADLMEAERIPEAPYYKADNLPFGKGYNQPIEPPNGMPANKYAATLPYIFCATSMETPYSNLHGVVINPDRLRRFGASIARALLRFFETAAIEGKIFQK